MIRHVCLWGGKCGTLGARKMYGTAVESEKGPLTASRLHAGEGGQDCKVANWEQSLLVVVCVLGSPSRGLVAQGFYELGNTLGVTVKGPMHLTVIPPCTCERIRWIKDTSAFPRC